MAAMAEKKVGGVQRNWFPKKAPGLIEHNLACAVTVSFQCSEALRWAVESSQDAETVDTN